MSARPCPLPLALCPLPLAFALFAAQRARERAFAARCGPPRLDRLRIVAIVDDDHPEPFLDPLLDVVDVRRDAARHVEFLARRELRLNGALDFCHISLEDAAQGAGPGKRDRGTLACDLAAVFDPLHALDDEDRRQLALWVDRIHVSLLAILLLRQAPVGRSVTNTVGPHAFGRWRLRVLLRVAHGGDGLPCFLTGFHVGKHDGVHAEVQHLGCPLTRRNGVVVKDRNSCRERQAVRVLDQPVRRQRLQKRLHFGRLITLHALHVDEHEVHLPIGDGLLGRIGCARGREQAEHDLIPRQEVDDFVVPGLGLFQRSR